MSSPGPSSAVHAVSSRADDSSQPQSISAKEVKDMSDDDFYRKLKYVPLTPDGIEALLNDPRVNSKWHLEEAIEERVRQGDLAIVYAILRKDSGLKPKVANEAIKQGNLPLVMNVVSKANVDSHYEGSTYLHIAAIYGQLNVARFLIETGADHELESDTPLPLSFRYSDAYHKFHSLRPVQTAAIWGYDAVFKYLLELELELGPPRDWERFLFWTITYFENAEILHEIVLLLCKESAGVVNGLVNVNLTNSDGLTLFHLAAKNAHIDIKTIELLLEIGANPFARGSTGIMPWDIIAQSHKHIELKLNYIYDFVNRSKNIPPVIYSWGLANDNSLTNNYSMYRSSNITGLTGVLGETVFPTITHRWLHIKENNDTFFTALVALAAATKGYDLKLISIALQFLSRTFVQHDAADHLLRFREASYNEFTFPKNIEARDQPDSAIHNKDPKANSDPIHAESVIKEPLSPRKDEVKGSQSSHVEEESQPPSNLIEESKKLHEKDMQPAKSSKSRAKIISLVIPYFHSRLRSSIINKRKNLKKASNFLEERQKKHSPPSGTEEEATSLALRFQNMRSMNIHEPRTLDESYYLGLSGTQLAHRNNNQVISSIEKHEEKRRVLMVSELWLWSMDDIVLSACGSHPNEGKLVSTYRGIFSDSYYNSEMGQDPQLSLIREIRDGNLRIGNEETSLQFAALIFSECVNFLDSPNYAGLKESVFHTFEKSVSSLYDEVRSYMNENEMDKIQIKQEMAFVDQISDIRDELNMIKSIITQQEEVWNQFYKSFEEDLPKWDFNNSRVAIRPKEQIPKFKRRIQRIEDEAQRVEQWIQTQLELKKAHASIKQSHNSTILSVAIIGFTVVTVVFTPLSFMSSLLAVPSSQFQWRPIPGTYMGKTYMTVTEIISLGATAGLVWLSIQLLRRKEKLSNEASNTIRKFKHETNGEEQKYHVPVDDQEAFKEDSARLGEKLRNLCQKEAGVKEGKRRLDITSISAAHEKYSQPRNLAGFIKLSANLAILRGHAEGGIFNDSQLYYQQMRYTKPEDTNFLNHVIYYDYY